MLENLRAEGLRQWSGYWPVWTRVMAIEPVKEPLNKSTRSAFQSEKPQIVRCDTSDSSSSYGRVAQRARCGFSGETLTGRAFAGPPPRLGSLFWNDQTTFAQAKPETPAKAPSRPRRLIQRFLKPATGPNGMVNAIVRGYAGCQPCCPNLLMS